LLIRPKCLLVSRIRKAIQKVTTVTNTHPDQFELSDHPTDPVSRVKFAPHSTKLLVASWDKNLYLHDISGNSSTLMRKFEHRAPILDVCWSEDETHAYTVGVDHDVRR
jgi:cell cycle arrest protein BUB3